MDLVTLDKLQAMKRHRRKKRIFLTSLMQCSLSLLCLGLLLSSPVWLPIACSSLRRFLVVSLPGMLACLFSPKCLFVLGNAIVVFLVGESRLSAGPASALALDVYEEYMVRSKAPSGSTAPVRAIGKEDDIERAGKDELEEEDCEEEEDCTEDCEEEEEEEEDFNGDVEEVLPADELNRRVEDFIARVNWERRIEASRMLIICN